MKNPDDTIVPDNTMYDAVIIGSGLGGLLCGYILSTEGYKVCILEKNNQIGGSLQTYVRDKCIFDTGVHYVGGLEKGQPLYQFFKYFGLIDKLKLRRMDEDRFEVISFGNGKTFRYGIGYDNFKKIMKEQFPGEDAAIDQYCQDLQELCAKFPLYNAEEGEEMLMDMSALEINAKEYFQKLTPNQTLQNVLAGTNFLYAGVGEKTPFYVHALVINSYIISSYRFVDGGSQIARLLSRSIKEHNGVIHKYAHVNKVHVGEELAEYVALKDGRKFYGKNFISDIHPSVLLDMMDTPKIRNAYKTRIHGLENTVSVFILNIILKKKTIKYRNYNVYHYDDDDVWASVNYDEKLWPTSHAIFFSAQSKDPEFSESVTAMAYMKYDEVAAWQESYNTVADQSQRGEEYEKFKTAKAELLIKRMIESVPELEGAIEKYYVATPLTYRDYIGTKDGSLYGVLKDYNDPIRTFLAPRTRVKNVLLTGQNMHMHGVYGVTVSAVKTCSELVGAEYLIRKIRNS